MPAVVLHMCIVDLFNDQFAADGKMIDVCQSITVYQVARYDMLCRFVDLQ